MNDPFKDEVKLSLPNGQYICFESKEQNPNGTSYIRFTDSDTSTELFYWDKEEWKEDPDGVMGAIMGVLCDAHKKPR